MVAWFAPYTFPTGTLAILSHTGAYDGLSFNGDFIRFRIKSSLGNMLETKWAIPDQPEGYMVAGVYNTEKIQLFINGEMVSEADVTDEFKVWLQEASSNLYLGQSDISTYRAAIDGISTFASALTPTQIMEMYVAGRDVIPTIDAVGVYGGSYWTGIERSVSLQREWSGDEWNNGVYMNSESISGDLKPQNDFITGLSKAGTWRGVLELGATELLVAGGVKIDWDGDGSFVVETSIDNGTVWSPVTNGRLAVNTIGMNTTAKILDIRVTFTGGVANDIATVRRLRATTFTDYIIQGPDTSRTLTLSGSVSSGLEYSEPIERSMSTGVDFYSGTATLSADTTTTPRNINTMEFWIRPRSLTLSGSGGYVFDTRAGGGTAYLWTQVSGGAYGFAGSSAVYINGVLTSSGTYIVRLNEWVHVVFVFTTAFNTPVVLGGGSADIQYGLIATYPTALTAAQALALYQSYVKVPVARVDDPGLITLADAATPINMYAYNWESQNV